MARLKGELFARLSLDYFDHPKIMTLSPEAIVAHLEMIVYSRKYRTDGHIPMRFAMRFASQVLYELSSNDPESPSIEKNEDGSVTIHGYADMQETSEQIAERRKSKSAAGQAGARARWEKDGKTDGTRHSSTHGTRHSKPDGKRDDRKMAETETETETVKEEDKSSSPSSEVAVATPRPEVSALLDLLDSELARNGLKKPSRTKANLNAARLLLDKDGRSVEQIETAIRWAQNNEFWYTNIRSMSKLREKYETLQSRARMEREKNQPGSQNRAQQRQDANLSVIDQLAALDAAERGEIEA